MNKFGNDGKVGIYDSNIKKIKHNCFKFRIVACPFKSSLC